MEIPLSRFECLDSSSKCAIEWIKRGVRSTPFAILADRQLAGQGQQGKSWSSPGGNLYLSLALPCVDPAKDELRFIPLRVALLVSRCLQSFLNIRVSLKWPNDIFVHGRKLAGILCQVTNNCSGGSDLVIGIGVNVSSAPELGPDSYSSISLQMLRSKTVTTSSLAQEILHHFSQPCWILQPLPEMIEEYSQYSLAKGFAWISLRGHSKKTLLFDGLDSVGQMVLCDINSWDHKLESEKKKITVSSAGHKYSPVYFVSQTAPLCVFESYPEGLAVAAFYGLKSCVPGAYTFINRSALKTSFESRISDFFGQLDLQERSDLSPIPIYFAASSMSFADQDLIQNKFRHSVFLPTEIRSRQICVWSRHGSVPLPFHRLRRLEVLMAYSKEINVPIECRSGHIVIYSPEESSYDILSTEGEFLGTFVSTAMPDLVLLRTFQAEAALDLKPKLEQHFKSNKLSPAAWHSPWGHLVSWSANATRIFETRPFHLIYADLKAIALMSIS